MTETQQTPTIDEARVEAFVGQLITDFAGAASTAMTVLGDRLGLFRALTGAGPVTAADLAARTGLNPRLVTEWLHQMAVSGYLTVVDGDRFELPLEHAPALSVVDSPVHVVAAGEIITGYFLSLERLETAFRGDGGLSGDEVPGCIYHGIERYFRTAYVNQLAQDWFPAVPGLVEKLEAGARVADVGCGHGYADLLIGRTWPNSRVTGFDLHAPSIATARARAIEAGSPANVAFHVADSAAISGYGPFDVVVFFDALHDLGDPVSALKAAYEALAPGGVVVAVEPWSADDWTSTIGMPITRIGYASSAALCTPGSLSQPGAHGLGTLGGPAKRLELLAGAGFSDPVLAADTGFNLVVAATKS
ncbi:SAM-dependent methyltransferase [Actinoplanes campanulatus]|uniref:SAM-dependent methyltransferase n=1 Tax=Actinoplanes campanulatus TaxID=113559 RepID=A0A7W5ACM5_9ACTN|nr:class I SAM-dependent methyltransferase [Actinoplanes campanulatus]MBB3093826.1 SAM-dependent methyltransferase [Actinoplanes campanulatus]GGN05939.1 SAM-dependent methyltransferase [Actinoplanes campanulatus]GID35097.1 SAM-dependent methyltransferase [Actinoplanes campanulatus]